MLRGHPPTSIGQRFGYYWFFDVKFEPRDFWLGVFWDNDTSMYSMGWGWSRALDVYICLIPCFPIKIGVRKMLPSPGVQASR